MDHFFCLEMIQDQCGAKSFILIFAYLLPVGVITVPRTLITPIVTVLVLVTQPAAGDTFTPRHTLELIRGAACQLIIQTK